MSGDRCAVLCIGAGPAGLTAAYLLSRQHVSVRVLEQDPRYVGGISRTVDYQGFGFDIGGHRFFSKAPEVEALWRELLGEDFLLRPRKSRIFYRGKLFDYPLRAGDALHKLGLREALYCVGSYLVAKLDFFSGKPQNFEAWVTRHFGRRLFEIFFKTYTEKVWGMKCTEISADWAAQRIRGLSLFTAVWHALWPQRGQKNAHQTIKTLVHEFHYPRRGPGMLWQAAAAKVEQWGGHVMMGQRVTALFWDTLQREWCVTSCADTGGAIQVYAENVISSMPLQTLVTILSPEPPVPVLQAAAALRYRDFLVVALIVKERDRFDDNWIYIHEPGVKVGRIQNFKSWSPEMVPDPNLNCYGMEYFCFEGDGLWNAADEDLVALARNELVALGLASAVDIREGVVVRQPKAYPVYDEGYESRVELIRRWLEATYPTLHLVGRNGMHKYNNQDHAMKTAMLTVQNILAGERREDVWLVNQDAEYHEEAGGGQRTGERGVPRRRVPET